MKKKKLFLGLSVLAGAVVLASCTVSQDNSTTTSKTNESTTTTTVAEKNYTVTWKNDDGSVIKTDTVKEGTVASYDGATPTKASDAEYSYTFKSWDKELSAVNADVVYTAVYEFTKNKYTYAFYDEDGTTELKKETVEYGTQISAPSNPEKQDTKEDDFTFDGWYDAKTGGNKVTSFSTITGNVTYYARYTSEKNKYTYTFYDEDGTSVLGTNNVAYGTQIEAPTNPTKVADDDYVYIFAGWYDAKEGGNKVESFGTVSGNVSYYARYTQKAACTITFYNEDGTDVLDTKKIAEGEQIVAPTDPTKQEDDDFAYSFDGWYDAATGGNKVTSFGTASGNTSYYARFNNVAKYYVIFYAEDGVTQLDSKKVAEGTQIVAPNNPTKAADAEYIYTFDAWYDAATSGNKVTEFGTVDGPKTYYARFNKALKITVSFVVDGTSYGEPQVIATGSKATKPANPIKTGFDFKYWTLDGTTAFDFNTELTSNTELTAYFEESTDIKEGFGEGFTSWETLVTTAGATTNSDGHYVLSKAVTIGNYSFAIVTDKTRVNKDYAKYVTQGATITITLKSAGTIYLEGNWGSDKKDGYVILKNGSTEVYKSKKYEHDMSESIAFSQAVPAGTYTISTVNASDSTASVSIQITKLYFEREANYADVTFSTEYGTAPEPRRLEAGDKLGEIADLYQDGYVFLGWYDAATGGNKVTADTVINETKTIYAQWKVYDPNDYVTISFDETTVGPRTTITKEKGETFSELEDLTKDGYAFKGWYTDASFNTPFNKDAAINSNVTLYAKFVEIITITFKNADGTVNDTLSIEAGEKIASSNAPAAPYIYGKKFDFWSLEGTTTEFDFENTTVNSNTVLVANYSDADTSTVQLITSAGDQESAYVEFMEYDNHKDYNVYYKNSSSATWTKIDKQLIRYYKGSSYNYYRADALGLKAGSYTLKVVPVDSNNDVEAAATVTSELNVVSYDRTGFAFSKNEYNSTGDGSGAYNADGSLKNGARVLYITKDNAKTVTLDITTDNKGTKTTYTGLQAIIGGYEKGCETIPLAIRFIGKVSKEDLDSVGSKEEGLQIKGKALGTVVNMTIEGVGNDATIYGFGLLIKNCTNLEVRNLGFMTKMDDDVSIDGGSSATNRNIWIHDCDFFYGANGSGDHAKGDGALDIKGTKYATLAYNHFWDCGKTTLNSNGDPVDYVSYHHNWFDHSDSRHPRIRMSTAVHVYNNYYDGISKYGIGAAEGGTSAFVENNYFRNCKYPMLSSMQGSDVYGGTDTYTLDYATFSKEDGGVIKSYGNQYEGTYTYIPYGCTEYVNKGVTTAYNLTGTTSTEHFDAYEATTRDEVVPSTVKSVKGGTTYSNFDTNSSIMYTYTVQTPEDAVVTVKAYSGRVQGGDFKWTFDNATEDTNYAVIAGLRSAIDNYSSNLISVLGIESSSSGSGSTDPIPSTSDVDTVIALIEALPESTAVTENDRTAINAAKAAYDALDETEQTKVTNYSKLQACIAALPSPSSFTINFAGASVETGNNKTAYNDNNIVIVGTKIADVDANKGLKFNSGYGFTITNNSTSTLSFVMTVVGNGKDKSFTCDGTTTTFGTTAVTITTTIAAGQSKTITTSTGGAFLTSIVVSQ
ncbi:MAG: InlB B-repeat-containing protein [Acholeplasmatales bacterium]|nr:InlB B-repeat-containing protein [Acholeplasmatales bacterium]